MHNAIFVIELLAAGVVGILAFVLLLSGASSKEIGSGQETARRFHGNGNAASKRSR